MSQAADKLSRQDKKRVALFLDGTWNRVDDNTNVWRLYSLCSKVGSDGLDQVAYYTKGVGTTYGSTIRGGMFGFGFDAIIIETYEWLISHYNDGDDLFIFGFSRGAYAARSLAGFIAKCGILKSGSPVGVGELFGHYKTGNSPTIRDLTVGQPGPKSRLEKWMLAYSIPADITMVGVWETVGALVGERGYLETGLRVPIKYAFHALAIDEHRKRFAPTLWTQNFHLNKPREGQPPLRDIAHVEQRWFVGAHADVGGGYESYPLPQLPLAWLMNKASALNLSFRETVIQDDAVYTERPKDSFKEFACGFYYYAMLGKAFVRVIGAEDVTIDQIQTVNVNETIDSSVFEHWRRASDYRPENLARWAAAHNVDPAALTGAVLAKDPAVAAVG